MNKTAPSIRAKSAALGGRRRLSGRADVFRRREAIALNIKKAVAGKRINPVAVGSDGLSLLTLNLKAVGNRQKRRMLARLIVASARRK